MTQKMNESLNEDRQYFQQYMDRLKEMERDYFTVKVDDRSQRSINNVTNGFEKIQKYLLNFDMPQAPTVPQYPVIGQIDTTLIDQRNEQLRQQQLRLEQERLEEEARLAEIERQKQIDADRRRQKVIDDDIEHQRLIDFENQKKQKLQEAEAERKRKLKEDQERLKKEVEEQKREDEEQKKIDAAAAKQAKIDEKERIRLAKIQAKADADQAKINKQKAIDDENERIRIENEKQEEKRNQHEKDEAERKRIEEENNKKKEQPKPETQPSEVHSTKSVSEVPSKEVEEIEIPKKIKKSFLVEFSDLDDYNNFKNNKCRRACKQLKWLFLFGLLIAVLASSVFNSNFIVKLLKCCGVETHISQDQGNLTFVVSKIQAIEDQLKQMQSVNISDKLQLQIQDLIKNVKSMNDEQLLQINDKLSKLFEQLKMPRIDQEGDSDAKKQIYAKLETLEKQVSNLTEQIKMQSASKDKEEKQYDTLFTLFERYEVLNKNVSDIKTYINKPNMFIARDYPYEYAILKRKFYEPGKCFQPDSSKPFITVDLVKPYHVYHFVIGHPTEDETTQGRKYAPRVIKIELKQKSGDIEAVELKFKIDDPQYKIFNFSEIIALNGKKLSELDVVHAKIEFVGEDAGQRQCIYTALLFGEKVQ